ncbi:MAG: diacylglycerol kinase, partial [Gemmatimonadetes bacterium]|nr:diacylglycerol kinase [Gemmatimonadota bacterium]NIR78812.1 diacylglycerol kinase [Gemmatimonadota bacterium]NIT88081.1 diacylglycerol kinase [Gemmatimonadota bacterium]NIU31911.1 diacylglycerol kinase [Gemmatimonadota bacterium]NIU36006.1 diacylglycerol kinase [Gemmatimonadota bacterium]
GDGTVQAVLTALDRFRPDGPWPALAVAPGGTANMTASDLGARGSPVTFLEALARRLEEGGGASLSRVRRPVLRVEGGGAGSRSGMFFGAGVVAAGVRYFQRRLDRVAVTGERISAVAVGRVLLGLAFGGETGEAAARSATVSVDGGPAERLEGLLFLASTLERLLLGTRPYWGEGEGPIHFTLVEKGARGLWRGLPRLALGRPGRRLTPERGYRSHEAARLELTLDGPIVLDGELYEARAAEGPLRISAERVAEWVVP